MDCARAVPLAMCHQIYVVRSFGTNLFEASLPPTTICIRERYSYIAAGGNSAHSEPSSNAFFMAPHLGKCSWHGHCNYKGC